MKPTPKSVPLQLQVPKVCGRQHCERVGVWVPVLVMWAKSAKPHSPARGTINTLLCDEHKVKSHVTDFVDDDSWNNIVDSFVDAGLAAPDRQLLQLEFTNVLELTTEFVGSH